MGLSTIISHLTKSASDLNYRSLSNLGNQKVPLSTLANECRKHGWRCMLVGDRVYIAKSDTALREFKSSHPNGTYTEL